MGDETEATSLVPVLNLLSDLESLTTVLSTLPSELLVDGRAADDLLDGLGRAWRTRACRSVRTRLS